MKLGRKPTLVRKVGSDREGKETKMPPLPSSRSASSGRSSSSKLGKKYEYMLGVRSSPLCRC